VVYKINLTAKEGRNSLDTLLSAKSGPRLAAVWNACAIGRRQQMLIAPTKDIWRTAPTR